MDINKKNVFLLQGGPAAHIGKHCYSGSPAVNVCYGDGVRTLTMGSYCSLGGGIKIFLGGEHGGRKITTFPFGIISKKGHAVNYSKGDVTIGSDVWIGDGATILSGVTIGSGVIVGANALVAKNIPPYAIVAGNPAKIIRYRFNKEIIEKLLEIKWWNWPEQKVEESIELLSSDNIEEFITTYYKGR